MISEGYALLKSLENVKYELQVNHPDVKRPGKKPGYRVGLGNDGLPQLAEEIDKDTMGSLWYHRDGKHNAFPVIKIQNALLPISAGNPLRQMFNDKKTSPGSRIKLLKEAFSVSPIKLTEYDRNKWNRLKSKASVWVGIFADIDEQYAALLLMLQRFLNKNVSAECFLNDMCGLIIRRLEQGKLEDVAMAGKLLFGILDKRNPEAPARADIPIALDIVEPGYPVKVASPKMGLYVSRHIPDSDTRGFDGICALQGKVKPLLKKRFPEPNLAELGETKLFSKYKATPCEFRYLKSISDWEDVSRSFPIGQQIATDIANSFSTLTATNLKGKTWRMVANGKWEGRGPNKREKKDLLLIYCDGQPVICDEAADTFGSDDREKRDQFEYDAGLFCKALDGLYQKRPESPLHILLIGKVDKEKKQVLMHIIPTMERMINAAERWKTAVWSNLPLVEVYFPPEEKGHKALVRRPTPPYPDRIVRLLSSKWVQDGLNELKIEGPSLCHVLDLMLRSPGKWEQTAVNLLQFTIQRTGSLLVGLAGAFHSKERKRIEKYKTNARVAALRSVALLGILLDALDRRKEVYMIETAFLLGRLLSLADTLHREYCMYVRKGSIPSQLIGNALMPVAADNPEDAIDRLRERVGIYQAWSMKVSGEEYRLGKWAVGQMGEITNAIKRPLPTKTDQTFRAELFLGYLARQTKSKGEL